jgi:GntR family transcriptional regulator
MAAPLYRQIAEDLRMQIESGSLSPGQQLQTELELREHYNASRNTIRDALRLLTTRGLIVARAGQGTFVAERMDPFITTLSDEWESTGFASRLASRPKPSLSVPRVEIQEAGYEVAAMLGLPQDAQVVSRQQIRSIDGTLWSLHTSFYPMGLVERGAERLLGTRNFAEGTLAYLKGTLGLDQVGYRDLIRVGPPSEEEARLFKLPDDGSISVITVLRTGYTQHGDPLRLTITAFPADRNWFVFNSGEVPTSA